MNSRNTPPRRSAPSGWFSAAAAARCWRRPSRGRHRTSRRVAGVRPDGPDHGLHHRACLRLPSQPGGHGRAHRRRPFSGLGRAALHRRPGDRRPARRCPCSTSSPAVRPASNHRRLRVERLWRASRPGIQPLAALVTEMVMTAMFLFIIMGATHGRAPAGFAPIAIGLGADPDPPDLDPGDQYLGQPGPQHRRRRCSPAAWRWASSGCSGWRRCSAAPSAGRFTPGCRPPRSRRSPATARDADPTDPSAGPHDRRRGAFSVARSRFALCRTKQEPTSLPARWSYPRCPCSTAFAFDRPAAGRWFVPRRWRAETPVEWCW